MPGNVMCAGSPAPPRFYLSASYDRRHDVALLANVLRGYGWQWTFDWTQCEEINEEVFREVAGREIEAIREADLVIVLLPGGRGTHVEMGAALALEKPVVLYTDYRLEPEMHSCPFYWHPLVERHHAPTYLHLASWLIENGRCLDESHHLYR